MRKPILIFLIGIVMFGCEKSTDLPSPNRNVVSEATSIPFEELLILLNVKVNDSTYLVIESIDSVSIYINDYYWSKISSVPVDTTKIRKTSEGNMFISDLKQNYLVIAQRDFDEPDYNIAGEFAKFLNSYYELKPGEYACLIESFQVTFNDNTTKVYYPYKYEIFKVEENSRNAFVSEIELDLD